MRFCLEPIEALEEILRERERESKGERKSERDLCREVSSLKGRLTDRVWKVDRVQISNNESCEKDHVRGSLECSN